MSALISFSALYGLLVEPRISRAANFLVGVTMTMTGAMSRGRLRSSVWFSKRVTMFWRPVTEKPMSGLGLLARLTPSRPVCAVEQSDSAAVNPTYEVEKALLRTECAETSRRLRDARE